MTLRSVRAVRALRALRALGALAVLLSAAACAKHQPSDRDPAEQSPTHRLTRLGALLIVENQRPVDYVIYLDRAGGQRIGTARGSTTERFALRGDLIPPTAQLRIIGRPIGGGELIGESITVPRGGTIRLRILQSSVFISADPTPETGPDSGGAPR